jgi:hypothetical protein
MHTRWFGAAIAILRRNIGGLSLTPPHPKEFTI